MEKLIKDPKKVNKGWHKDEEGNIRDENNYKWYGHQIETKTNTGFNLENFEAGGGAQNVLRTFTIMKNPTQLKMTGEQIYNHHLPFFKKSLQAHGMTTDDRFAPSVFDKGDKVMVVLVSKPSAIGFNKYIYDGMKHGQSAVQVKSGIKVGAYKTDDVKTDLQKGLAKKQ